MSTPAANRPRGSKPPGTSQAGLFVLVKPYKGLVATLAALTILANALNLVVPKLIASAIDHYRQPDFALGPMIARFLLVCVSACLLTYLQSLVQTYASEQVAKDLRARLAAKLATQTYSFVEHITPAKLLTNLTSDVDGVKLFVSMAISTIISSIFLIAGSSVLLLSINWRLGLSVLGIVPFIGFTFYIALKKVRELFKKGQEAIDWLNRVINESILGATLIRLLNSQQVEYQKFVSANAEAKNVGLSILGIMSALIPTITLAANGATVIILLVGGRFVIAGRMTLGDFSAFNTYLALLIFPIILLGFMSNIMAQAGASYMRLSAVLGAAPPPEAGELRSALRGDIGMNGISLKLADKDVLKDVSFSAKAGSTTAIIGPTAAGKTQMLYVLIGLLKPESGTVTYDGEPLEVYDREALLRQVGFVFQDSILFNLTLRENIAFSAEIPQPDMEKAIATAELQDFVATLPKGLDTLVSERGSSLSGGQKQRVMLARALALNPKVLLLDDFTARVDASTERAILHNIQQNYPGITLISVTQKISSVEHYDQIILLMEGEVLATGTHGHLLETSPEYVQIYESQRSTNLYEIHS
ncbi:MAG: ABC transporter ATP-binding protein [Bryobacteraceae bacterium]